MTAYSPYLNETGPGSNAGDSDPYSMGVELRADSTCWITAIHWWQAAAGSAKSTATRTGALLRNSDQSNLSGTQTFGATADGWNSLTLSSPVQLTSGVYYKAVVCHPAGGYSADSHYYDSGAGASDTAFGPVTIRNSANANDKQNSYQPGGTLTYPTAQFNAARYWVSFTVSDTDPASGLTGALAGSLPALTGALTGSLGAAPVTGVLAGNLPALTGVLLGAGSGITGVLAPGAGSAIPGQGVPGEMVPGSYGAGNLPALTGALYSGAAIAYPLRAGAVTDNRDRYRVGVLVDNRPRYRAGVPS